MLKYVFWEQNRRIIGITRIFRWCSSGGYPSGSSRRSRLHRSKNEFNLLLFYDSELFCIHVIQTSQQEKTLLESDIYEDYVRSGVCRLSIAKKEFFKVNFAFPLPIASPLKPFLNQKWISNFSYVPIQSLINSFL